MNTTTYDDLDIDPYFKPPVLTPEEAKAFQDRLWLRWIGNETPRSSLGQFVKGHRSNIAHEFKPGNVSHNRRPDSDRFIDKATGYMMIRSDRGTFEREHTLIAEKILGRRMKMGEAVHHLDGCKTNNAHTNLLICSQSLHRHLESIMCRLYQKEHFAHTLLTALAAIQGGARIAV